MLFRGRLLDRDFSPGPETLETRLVDDHEIPWSEIAFATVRNTLIHYFNDRRSGQFGFHMGTVNKMGRDVDSTGIFRAASVDDYT